PHACDHVARNRPRCTAEAKQRDAWRKIRLAQLDCIVNRRKYAMVELSLEPRQSVAIRDGVELWPLAVCKLHGLPPCVWNNQNIGERNRGIETESTEGWEGGFGGKFGSETELEKVSRLFAQPPIFRKITPGLPHQPYRRWTMALTRKNVDQRLIHCIVPAWP